MGAIGNGIDKFGGWQPTKKGIPVGQGVLLAVGLIPGKLIPMVVRSIIVSRAPVLKSVKWTQYSSIAQIAAGLLAAWGWKSNLIKRWFGNMGSDILSATAVTGAIETAYGSITNPSNRSADLSDALANKVSDKIGALLRLSGPGLGAQYADTQSAAFGPLEEAYAGPKPAPTGLAGSEGISPYVEGGGRQSLASPLSPIARTEEILKQKSYV